MKQAFRVKSEQFWTSKISKETGRPCQLWSSIDHMLGNFRSSTSSCFTADDFILFYQCRVEDIRVCTEDVPSPMFAPSSGTNSAILLTFSLMTSSSLFAALLPSNPPSILSQRGYSRKVQRSSLHSSPRCAMHS